ncbi:MAG TPA: outer membrane beta-barrel protein [Sphingomonadaceae bacterium]|nr:outer membrane beta-barrel protein [Sphingomonadaceae bacterium]
MARHSFFLLWGSLVIGSAGTAQAQMLPPDESLLTFGRYVAVRDRVVPGYQPTGIPVGSFTLNPSVEVSSEYNDNVLTLPTDKVDDSFVRVAPTAQLQSNWSRTSLTLTASGQIDRYMHRTSENEEDVDLSVYGIQQLGDSTRVRVIGRFKDARESRESQDAFTLTERPVRYQTKTAGIGVSQRFANVLISGEAGITHSNYFDATLPDGMPLDQDYRDNDLKRLRARAEILQSPALAYFVQGTYDTTDYRLDSTIGADRGSKAYELLGGVRFELPVLVRGEVGVGYVHADYHGAQFRSFSGLAINSKVLFFPSQLTTVTVTAQRSVKDSGIPTSSGYTQLVGGVQIDHELLRSLILTAHAEYERDRFNGIDRHDRRFTVGASADYKLNRNLSLRLSYDRLDLSSSGIDRYKSFDRNRVLVGIGLRM